MSDAVTNKVFDLIERNANNERRISDVERDVQELQVAFNNLVRQLQQPTTDSNTK